MKSSRLLPFWARHPAALTLVSAGAVALACTGTLDVSTGDPSTNPPGADASTNPPPPPSGPDLYEPTSVRTYVTKVKDLMLGLPPTEEEIAAVTKDPTALRGMVDAWFVRPEAQAKLGLFFKKAFQQTQISQNDFLDQTVVSQIGTLPMFTQAQESMSRTALKLIADGKPFSETVTTHTYMMTPMLMSMMLAYDQIQVDDAGKVTMSFPMPDGTLATSQNFYATYQQGSPIPLSQTMDPNSPNFLHFAVSSAFTCTVPKLDGTGHVITDVNGKAVTQVVSYSNRKYTSVAGAFLSLWGYAVRDFVSDPNDPNGPPIITIPSDVLPAQKPLYIYNCGSSIQFTSPSTTPDDLVWRPVTVRMPNQGEKLTPFYDLPKLRQANEIVVRTPRVGFFSTPAFFANWTTNKSNQHRDTLNQALIVGIGRSINPVDKGTATVLDNGKDGAHSDPNSPCYSCHQTMDPMRNVFRQAYSYSYHSQHDPTQLYSTASFDYLGEKSALASLDDFAGALVKHPLYPIAWTQKLCFYANSSACVEDDPEFQRVAKAFADSNFDFHKLVTELFSSPLVTGATKTKTWSDLGETVSIARQDHYCAALTNRLGLATSLCTGITDGTTNVAVNNNIPSDGYLRGAESPALSTDETPFYRGATEFLCNYAAGLVVDKTNSRYQSSKKDAAITDFVSNIMGITSADPNYAAVSKLLADHYDAAVKAGASPTDALKSTFTTACLSPTSVGLGL